MVTEESNLTFTLDYFKTLHFNNCYKYLKDALQSYKAVGLCYYEREQRMKSIIMLIKSAIYTKTGTECCLHNTHTYSHSCVDPEIPFLNCSFLYLLIQSVVYSVSHCLCDLGKKPHAILIQLNHYKKRYSYCRCKNKYGSSQHVTKKEPFTLVIYVDIA